MNYAIYNLYFIREKYQNKFQFSKANVKCVYVFVCVCMNIWVINLTALNILCANTVCGIMFFERTIHKASVLLHEGVCTAQTVFL